MDSSEAETLSRALEAQVALQREADHRVKNTLQLIASLLQLQARRAPDPAIRDALKGMQQRLAAVSAAQRRVSREDGHEWVEADGMVRDVVGDLAVGVGRDDIVFELKLEPLLVAARDGAPLALIANELVGNAVRHGCPEGACRVEVELARTADGYRFVVADEGVPGAVAETRPGVGMTICQLLAQQLRGQVEIDGSQPGRRVVVSVPMQAQSARAAE